MLSPLSRSESHSFVHPPVNAFGNHASTTTRWPRCSARPCAFRPSRAARSPARRRPGSAHPPATAAHESRRPRPASSGKCFMHGPPIRESPCGVISAREERGQRPLECGGRCDAVVSFLARAAVALTVALLVLAVTRWAPVEAEPPVDVRAMPLALPLVGLAALAALTGHARSRRHPWRAALAVLSPRPGPRRRHAPPRPGGSPGRGGATRAGLWRDPALDRSTSSA